LFRNNEDNLSGYENDSEQTTRALDGLDAHIFNIQTLFLIKAIAMFNARAQTPVVINLLNNGGSAPRAVCGYTPTFTTSEQSFFIFRTYG
jgi:hypothetical protein